MANEPAFCTSCDELVKGEDCCFQKYCQVMDNFGYLGNGDNKSPWQGYKTSVEKLVILTGSKKRRAFS